MDRWSLYLPPMGPRPLEQACHPGAPPGVDNWTKDGHLVDGWEIYRAEGRLGVGRPGYGPEFSWPSRLEGVRIPEPSGEVRWPHDPEPPVVDADVRALVADLAANGAAMSRLSRALDLEPPHTALRLAWRLLEAFAARGAAD